MLRIAGVVLVPENLFFYLTLFFFCD